MDPQIEHCRREPMGIQLGRRFDLSFPVEQNIDIGTGKRRVPDEPGAVRRAVDMFADAPERFDHLSIIGAICRKHFRRFGGSQGQSPWRTFAALYDINQLDEIMNVFLEQVVLPMGRTLNPDLIFSPVVSGKFFMLQAARPAFHRFEPNKKDLSAEWADRSPLAR